MLLMVKNMVVDKYQRLNLTLSLELNQRLNKYVLEIANRRGEIPHAIRTKIARAAIEEWLNKHEKDFGIYDKIE